MSNVRIDEVKMIPNPVTAGANMLIQVELSVLGILDNNGDQILDSDGSCIEFV